MFHGVRLSHIQIRPPKSFSIIQIIKQLYYFRKPVVNSTAITSNLTKANLERSKNPENVPKATHVNATLLLSPGNSTRANPRNITNTNLGNSTKPNPGNSTKSNLEQATNLNATLLNKTKLVNVSSPKTRMNAGPRRTNVLIPQIISRSHGGLHNISNHRVVLYKAYILVAFMQILAQIR